VNVLTLRDELLELTKDIADVRREMWQRQRRGVEIGLRLRLHLQMLVERRAERLADLLPKHMTETRELMARNADDFEPFDEQFCGQQ
jgi:hypothetical protein